MFVSVSTLSVLCSQLSSVSNSTNVNPKPIFAFLLSEIFCCCLVGPHFLSAPPSSFSPHCLSVSQQRGDSKSPRRKPIRLRESAGQSGTGFLIWIYLRDSAEQSLTCLRRPALIRLLHHLHRCRCASTLTSAALYQFACFPLWFYFRRGMWRL